MIGTRHELGGLFNVRDLGGYPGVDGRNVKRGMLFRASSLHRLDDELAWREFGARCVVDLRYDREREAFPLPEFITNDTHTPLLPNHWKGSEAARALPPAEHLTAVYHLMLELGGQSVREILAALAEPDAYPAVFFCMAGKDRTGVVAAIVLSLLGVSDADIADDFHLSGEQVLALVEDLKTKENYEDHPMMNQSESLLRAPREAMQMFLEEVATRYGGSAGYVSELNVPQSTVTALQEVLLEKPRTAMEEL